MDELRYQVDLLNAMNQRIQADERMYRLICDSSSNAVLYFNIEKRTIRMLGNWSHFFEDVSIKSISDLTKLYAFVEEQSVLQFRELIFRESDDNVSESAVFKMSQSGRYFECSVHFVRDNYGKITDKIVRFIDVTQIKNQNDELAYMAYFDTLTGLYNRNYFVSRLGDFIREAEKNNTLVSVMFIDLDDFNYINNGMGIVYGDEVIRQFGNLLADFKSDNVIVSHYTEDTYCIAIYDPDGNNNPDCFYNKLKDRLKKPFKLSSGNEIYITFCMGVAEYPESASSTLELINCSRIVMYRAQKKGKGEVQYFDATILKDFINAVNIDNKLKEAIFANNFSLNFQPQYFSESQKLRGVEALIRWRDNDGKMVPPSVFIPIAEKNGTIIPIGAWVLEESIKTYKSWKDNFGCSFKLSINISAIQYKKTDFVDDVLNIIKKYDIQPSDIELEITESILIEDFNDVYEKLVRLRDYGIRVSLDDFGTGYSSLSYLKELPIDTLKIDKSFIDTISNDQNARIILESIIFMSKKLGFETIAEGVETDNQYEYIKSIGCNCIQGYFFSKPVDKEGIERLLINSYL